MRSLGIPLLTVMMITMLLAGCGNKENNQAGAGASTIYGGEMNMKRETTIKGEEIANTMLEGQYQALYAQFGEGLQSIITEKDFEAVANEFVSDVTQFQLTSSMYVNEFFHYVWQDKQTSKGVMAVVDQHDIIEGFQVLSLTAYPETDEQSTKIEYQLPFSDEWLVFWGGKNVFLNYHYEYEQMRYAYDFIGTKDGYSYSGDPLNNESYYAFGREVLAPADGTVIAVTDGIEDNIPGEMNADQPLGNMVIIQHEHGEFSLLAHFKKGSIVVQVGDKVTSGQLLGECGNSGNSSEAHIHYQVYKLDEGGKEQVLPIRFVGGKEWIRGEIATGQ